MKAIIIGNPASGKGDVGRLKRCAEFLSESYDPVEIWPTERPDHATELASLAGDDVLVVAAGGDGTINEVINGLHPDALFGIIPTGTANVLARELDLPLNVDRAAKQIVRGEELRIDLGVATDSDGTTRKFACMAGIGFDANVVQEVPAKMKKNLGAMAFAITAFRVLAAEELPHISIESNGDLYEAQFAILANGNRYGGDFRSSEAATLTNGSLDVVLVDKVSKLLRPDILTRILARQPLSRDTTNFSAVKLSATSTPPVPVQIDGEVWGKLPMNFHIEPSSLRVVC